LPSAERLESFYRTDYRAQGTAGDAVAEAAEGPNSRSASQAAFVHDTFLGTGDVPQNIVDVGCGFGQLLRALHDRWPSAALYGLEIAEACSELLRAHGIQARQVTLEQVEGNPFAPTEFDLLTCSHVLEHSSSPPKFLEQCRQLLRCGGLAVFEVPNCTYEYGGDAPHLVFFTPATIVKALTGAGFEVERISTCGPPVDTWVPRGLHRVARYFNDHAPVAVQELAIDGVKRLPWYRAWKAAENSQRREQVTVEAHSRGWFSYGDDRSIAIRVLARRLA
jgi:2-polyprenyl-3-methyl-5-hydroxy-6-metoxy-1,4-benzoquinol methylase